MISLTWMVLKSMVILKPFFVLLGAPQLFISKLALLWQICLLLISSSSVLCRWFLLCTLFSNEIDPPNTSILCSFFYVYIFKMIWLLEPIPVDPKAPKPLLVYSRGPKTVVAPNLPYATSQIRKRLLLPAPQVASCTLFRMFLFFFPFGLVIPKVKKGVHSRM